MIVSIASCSTATSRSVSKAGGFRSWWRALTGSDETLEQAHLQRLAGRFSRCLHAWAKQQGIPLIHCTPGERKHGLAESYLPQDPSQGGLFPILVAKAPGLVWEVQHSKNGVPHLQRKTPWPYVNHYHFHLIDPDWGRITVKMSGHPPFGIQVMRATVTNGSSVRPAGRLSPQARRVTASWVARSRHWIGSQIPFAISTP